MRLLPQWRVFLESGVAIGVFKWVWFWRQKKIKHYIWLLKRLTESSFIRGDFQRFELRHMLTMGNTQSFSIHPPLFSYSTRRRYQRHREPPISGRTSKPLWHGTDAPAHTSKWLVPGHRSQTLVDHVKLDGCSRGPGPIHNGALGRARYQAGRRVRDAEDESLWQSKYERMAKRQ